MHKCWPKLRLDYHHHHHRHDHLCQVKAWLGNLEERGKEEKVNPIQMILILPANITLRRQKKLCFGESFSATNWLIGWLKSFRKKVYPGHVATLYLAVSVFTKYVFMWQMQLSKLLKENLSFHKIAKFDKKMK